MPVDLPSAIEPYYRTIWWSGIPYYYANETYYALNAGRNEHQVVVPPDNF